MAKLKPLGKRDTAKLADRPVRNCNERCWFFNDRGKGCQYFQADHVKLGEPCMYDLVNMKKYADAFATGQTDAIKEDASKITAMIMMQIENMLQQVNSEGATVWEPIMDARGAVVYIPDPNWRPSSGRERSMVPAMRMHDHPLIARSIQLAKSIGINLSEFKLTPKSADEKTKVSGHIVVEHQLNMKEVKKEREATDKRFLEAIRRGNELTDADPVMQRLLENEEIVGE